MPLLCRAEEPYQGSAQLSCVLANPQVEGVVCMFLCVEERGNIRGMWSAELWVDGCC